MSLLHCQSIFRPQISSMSQPLLSQCFSKELNNQKSISSDSFKISFIPRIKTKWLTFSMGSADLTYISWNLLIINSTLFSAVSFLGLISGCSVILRFFFYQKCPFLNYQQSQMFEQKSHSIYRLKFNCCCVRFLYLALSGLLTNAPVIKQ